MRRTHLMLANLRSGLSLLLGSESGIALPTALTTTTLALGLGTVAAVGSIAAQQGSVRDYDTKQALAAAEAGAERALLRQNVIETTAANPCLVLSGSTLVAGDALADGWCPQIDGVVNIGGETVEYSYRVSPPEGTDEAIDIVSTGTSDEVERRIELGAVTETGNIFGQHTVIGLDGISMNSNAGISGNAASNGNITLNSNAEMCGNAQHGNGYGLILNGNAQLCSGYTSGPGTVSLPPVNQGNVVTTNSNGRFFTQDLRTGGNNVSWTSSTRTMNMDSNGTLTMGGTNYSFCRLIMKSNTVIFVAAGAHIRIYFDTPEACNLPAGTRQLDMSSNARIVAVGGAASIALLFVGSENIATSAHLNSNTSVCAGELILYAPLTDVHLNSNSSICGAVAGQSVTMDSNSEINSTPTASAFDLPIPLHFEPTKYVECGPATTGAPDSGC